MEMLVGKDYWKLSNLASSSKQNNHQEQSNMTVFDRLNWHANLQELKFSNFFWSLLCSYDALVQNNASY